MELSPLAFVEIAQKHYPSMVSELAKDPKKILETLTDDRLHTLMLGLGVLVGMTEQLDLVKKVCIYNKDLPVGVLTSDATWSAATLTEEQTHLLHMVIGVIGEAGELVDAVIQHIAGKPLDRENVLEELGDLHFYATGVANQLGFTQEAINLANKLKLLGGRYKSGKYSDEQAQQRADKAAGQ